MATIINNPSDSGNADSSLGLVLGVIVVIALVVLFFVYGLPALRQNNANTTPGGNNINVTLPSGGGTGGGTGGTNSGSSGGGSGAY